VPVAGELFDSIDQKIELEARNVVLQFDEVLRLVEESRSIFDLTPDLIRRLHRVAVQGIYVCAGEFRKWPVTIKNSHHKPHEARFVTDLVKEMCEKAISTEEWTPVQTAGYLLWRFNWIHPFGGGNGRTSRAVCYWALCIRLGFSLPGKLTIPEQIVNNRKQYQEALEDADDAWRQGILDFSKMTKFLEECLERQLSYLSEDPLPPSSNPGDDTPL
jgi:Fic family protein